MSVAPARKVKSKSSLIPMLKGCGCFFVFTFLFISLSIFICLFYVKPIVDSVRTDVRLPQFEGPEEQDFWNLQEKLLNDREAMKNDYYFTNWDLTPGQFNALLSYIQIPPVAGFCLARVRHEYKDKNLRYYFIGSGFTLKRLIISFTLRRDEKSCKPSEIRVNCWKVPGDSIEERLVMMIISSVANVDKTNLLNNLISGKIKPYE